MQPLIDYFSAHPHVALAAVFAASVLEALAVIGTFVPGSTVVFAGGVLVGLHVLSPAATAGIAILGAILGDALSYELGRRYRSRIPGMWPVNRYPALLVGGQAYFERNGAKSVFLGRFLSPVRAIVPVVAGMAGMPPARFYAMNVLSALAWSVAHLAPGMLFGASLQIAGAVSSRLAVLLVAIVIVLWVSAKALRWLLGAVWPAARSLRDELVRRAQRRSGLHSRILLSLLDPARPESTGLLIAAVLLLSGGWAFLAVLEDVVANDPLVRVDVAVYGLLQGARSAWLDSVMVVVTGIGGAAVTISLVVAVSLALAARRCWRTLWHWLAAAGFAELLVWGIKAAVARARPVAAYSGVEQFSFPSGHAALAITVYGFLAFLLASGRSPRVKTGIVLIAACAIGLIALSRLYLGVHWLSDVLASLTLGLAWVAVLAIAYINHVRDERMSALLLAGMAAGAIGLAGTWYAGTHFKTDLMRYARPSGTQEMSPHQWLSAGWRTLPAERAEMAGEGEEPFTMQWAAEADAIRGPLLAHGWQVPPPWRSRAVLLWLLPDSTAGDLPVLPRFNRGQPEELTFLKPLGPDARLILRLWRTPIVVQASPPRPLWLGTVAVEDLRRPGGWVTSVRTRPDRGEALEALQRDAAAFGIRLERRDRHGRTLFLFGRDAAAP